MISIWHPSLSFLLSSCLQTEISGPTPTPSTSPNHLIRLPDPFLRLTRPLPATYATLASRSIAIAFTRQGPCHPLPYSTPRRHPPVHRRGHVSHFIISTAYQLQGAGVITPLAYLLTISLTSSVREGGTKHDTAPLQPAPSGGLVSIPLEFVLPSVLVVFTSSPCWIASWQPFLWWMGATQALDPLAVPSPPSSPPSSKPGYRPALFQFTLFGLSTAAAIAHCVFLPPPTCSPSA